MKWADISQFCYKNQFPSTPTAELEKGGDWSSLEELMGSSPTHTRIKGAP